MNDREGACLSANGLSGPGMPMTQRDSEEFLPIWLSDMYDGPVGGVTFRWPSLGRWWLWW